MTQKSSLGAFCLIQIKAFHGDRKVEVVPNMGLCWFSKPQKKMQLGGAGGSGDTESSLGP